MIFCLLKVLEPAAFIYPVQIDLDLAQLVRPDSPKEVGMDASFDPKAHERFPRDNPFDLFGRQPVVGADDVVFPVLALHEVRVP